MPHGHAHGALLLILLLVVLDAVLGVSVLLYKGACPGHVAY